MEEKKIDELDSEVKSNSNKNKVIWKYVLIVVVLLILILLLIKACGTGKKYKIKLHYGDEVIEVDKNFKLKDLEVDGGKVSFLVDSEGYIVEPDSKLDPKKEYSGHLIPDGKEIVKVTYINGDWKLTVEYEKGSGLLFPKVKKNPGYIFMGWLDEETNTFPALMTPVEHDMTLKAKFAKKTTKDGEEKKCTINCDTDNDGKCDLNCDTNDDGKPDKNVDKDGDGKCDLNCDTNNDGKCDFNCDTNNDGKCDSNCEKDEDNLQSIKENGDLELQCYDEPGVVVLTNKEYFVNATIDGKEIKPCSDCFTEYDWFKGYPVFDLTQYAGPGKIYHMIFNFIKKDKNGQKYYYILEGDISFRSDCDQKGANGEVTFKCDDYENDGGFFYTAPVKKDQIKSATVDGKELTTENYKDGYPVYDLANYFEDGKTLNIVFEYNSKDSDGNTSYTTKVLFPVCEFGVSEYTLTLDPNGGKVNPTSLIFIRGQIIYNLPYPTRSGYQFVGWYTAKSGGKLVSDDTNTEMPNNDMTLYAQWESNNTASPSPSSSPKPSNSPSASPSASPSPSASAQARCPDGYSFSGNTCTAIVTDTKDAIPDGYECTGVGYELNNDNKCVKEVAPVCQSGYEEYAGGCVYLTPVGYSYRCPSEAGTVPLDYDYQTGKCVDATGSVHDEVTPERYCPATQINDKCGRIANRADKVCPSDSTQSSTPTAFICEMVTNAQQKYSCDRYGSKYSVEGDKCTWTYVDTKDPIY